MRHWFTGYGAPGSFEPVCSRCGVPNPYVDPSETAQVFDEEQLLKYQRGVERLTEAPFVGASIFR